MSDERDELNELNADEPYTPKTSGWPMWHFEADKILSGIHHWVQRGGDESDVAFADFLQILDAFVSQLIKWGEQNELPELREWAGQALADRLQFLWTQKGDWCSENEGFQKRWAEFGDKRRTRSPRSYLGWLAGDYLRKLMHRRTLAGVLPQERISYLKELAALPDFSPESALKWGEFVFERMEEDEQKIMNSPVLRKCQTRDSRERRRSGAVRLYDFKQTIVKAIVSLASKPVGHIRGITRPPY
jgi:hypothetical protein